MVHPVSSTVGARAASHGVKRPGRGADHPSESSDKDRLGRAVPVGPVCAFMACYREKFTIICSDAEDEVVQVETGFVWHRTGTSGRLVCEHAIESLGAIKCGEFLGSMRKY